MAIPFLSPIGNINISDGTPQLKLTDTSSSATTTLTLDGVNLTLQINGTDGDFTIIGKDGSSYINLLAFDTSAGGTATFVGHIIPTTDNAQDLGTTDSKDFRTLYVRNIDLYNNRLIVDASGTIARFSDHSTVGDGFQFMHLGTEILRLGNDTATSAVFAGSVTGTSATFNGGITVDGIYIDGTEIDL